MGLVFSRVLGVSDSVVGCDDDVRTPWNKELVTDEDFVALWFRDAQQTTCQPGARELERLAVVNRHVTRLQALVIHLQNND